MDDLPDELLLYILTFLSPSDVLALQATCHRLLRIGRDSHAWKDRCFEDSRAGASRRRERLLAEQGRDARIAHLRQVLEGLDSSPVPDARTAKDRSLANWDPAYPGEDINFYQEYIERHAALQLTWFRHEDKDSPIAFTEAVGIALLPGSDHGMAQKVLSPLGDGSVCIYDIGSTSTEGRKAPKLVHQTAPNVLSGRVVPIVNETEATDIVSIDSRQRKAYIASADRLNELDLTTMQVVQEKSFPFPITALSPAQHPMPLTVGTSMILHLYDPRAPTVQTSSDTFRSARCELIAGRNSSSVSNAHVTLSQPGPLSILHDSFSSQSSIWVAGRFTSLLHYDRRTWPRISSTVFSGARLSSLAMIPFPYLPRALDLNVNLSVSVNLRHAVKSAPGITLVAAGEYKGKGSLELYGLSGSTLVPELRNLPENYYRNRQTASKSRLLSVAPHGARIVFSDGDGNLKWLERDGSTAVRTFNINTDVVMHSTSEQNHGPHPTQRGLFANQDDGPSDIVRKIVPRVTGQAVRSSADELTRDDLLLWTGDGRLGILGFGMQVSDMDPQLHAAAEDAEDAAKQGQERQYERHMREALERQADETRFVHGLGLGYASMG